jgi:hypothetical protein
MPGKEEARTGLRRPGRSHCLKVAPLLKAYAELSPQVTTLRTRLAAPKTPNPTPR